MQNVSTLYKNIVESNDYYVESAVVVCDNLVPLPNDVVNDGYGYTLNPLCSYNEEQIWSIKTKRQVFSNNSPQVGCCTCGEIDLQMLCPNANIPPMARVTPYIRLVPNSVNDNIITPVAPKTVTLTSTDAYTGYYYFVNNKRLSKGDYYIIEYDYSVSGVTTSNAVIYSQLNGAIVSPGDSFNAVNTSGHHIAWFSVTQAQADYTSSTRMRMRLRYANAGATFTISNVKMYSSPSEWVRKGVFFIDTREVTKNDDDLRILTIHGYDSMLKANAEYPVSSEASPTDIQAINIIASAIGVEVDDRTTALIDRGYEVVAPIGYTMIETLSHIASAYGGNFIINDVGKLQFIPLFNLPYDEAILADEDSNPIVIGEYCILVGGE